MTPHLRQNVRESSDERLRKLRDEQGPSEHRDLAKEILAERAAQAAEERAEKRHQEICARLVSLEKPHWTTTPSFWLIVATVLLGGLASWLGWLQVSRSGPSDSSLPPSSLLTPPQEAKAPLHSE